MISCDSRIVVCAVRLVPNFDDLPWFPFYAHQQATPSIAPHFRSAGWLENGVLMSALMKIDGGLSLISSIIDAIGVFSLSTC